MTRDGSRRHDPPAQRLPPEPDADRGEDLEALFAGCPPRSVDPRTVDRLTTRALDRIRKRVRTDRARRRAMMVAAALASAAALVLAAWPRPETGTPGDSPSIVARPPAEPAGTLETRGPRTETDAVPSGGPSGATDPAATASRAIATTIELRTSRREVLRELRRGGRAVVESLVLALKTPDVETSLAAAQLLASLATDEADTATRRVLEDGLEEGLEDGLPAKTAETLIEELLHRRDRAGRRLVRSLLETPAAGGLIVRLLGDERSPRAIDILGEASGSPSLPLSSKAIELLSHRRPRQAATAFWKAAESFAATSPLAEGTRSEEAGAEPSEGLADFLRDTLPRLSESALALLEEDIRRRPPFTRSDAWTETLPASLGQTGSREAWPLLVAIVETDGGRPAVLRAFGALGDVRAVPILERYVLLDDDRAEAAIRSLAEVPDAAGVHALLDIYLGMGSAGHLVPHRRSLLASSLLRDRGTRALAELRWRLARLPDQRTLGALIELFPETASDELARLLPNVDRRGRPQVFRALARLGTGAAINVLIDALEDPSFRSLARQSLTSIAHRDLGSRAESWREWLRDHDPGSRRADFSPGPFDIGPLHDRTGAAPVLAFKTHTHDQEEA